MTKEREALKLALAALEKYQTKRQDFDRFADEIIAIKEALAQPEQEPVATVTSETGNPDVTMSWWHEPALRVGTKLYTTPPKREWVGLSRDDVEVMVNLYKLDPLNTAFQIEAKLKELNHD